MTRIRNLFLLLTIIGPLHMGEQLLTGIEEFYMIRGVIGRYHAWFDPAFADSATVLLVTVVWTLCSLMFYAVLYGGLPRLVVMGLMGIFGVQELHHIVEAIEKGGYDPGVVTCIPYAIAGAFLVQAVWREFKRQRSEPAAAAALVPVRE